MTILRLLDCPRSAVSKRLVRSEVHRGRVTPKVMQAEFLKLNLKMERSPMSSCKSSFNPRLNPRLNHCLLPRKAS